MVLLVGVRLVFLRIVRSFGSLDVSLESLEDESEDESEDVEESEEESEEVSEESVGDSVLARVVLSGL